MPLRVGIAGLGTASALSLPVLARHPGVRVTAAADSRADALARFRSEFAAETFSSVEAMCASDTIDAVYVCTPNFLHAEHATTASEHGKHVLVEKPMALTLDECDAMIDSAERSGVVLALGHTMAHEAAPRRMRRLVSSGELGTVLMVHTWAFTDLLYRPRAAWELDTARGGGVVFIQAPHQVDVVRLIAGGIVRSVRATTGSADAYRSTEGHYTAFVDFESGASGTLVYSAYAHFDTAELGGWIDGQGYARAPETHARTRAAARVRGDEDAERDAKRYGPASALGTRTSGARGAPYFGITLVSCAGGDIRQTPDGLRVYGDEGPREVSLAGEPDGRVAMIDDLVAAARGARAPRFGGRWGKATLEVCLAVLESSRRREEVQLHHQVAADDE